MAASVARRQVGNLPAEVTSFVGRRREMSEARRLLGHTRLLTLAGPGGVGKTRLALSAAGQLRRVFTDGVWLVDLASVHEPDLLAVTVLHTLHVHDRSARPPAPVLRDYLADKSLLLILDNCEHLLDSSAELATELLRGAPGLRILVTSREPLRVTGEQVLPVPPLSVPEVGASATTDIARYEAVALFAERAAAVVPGFTVHDDNADAVAQVVRRLD